MEICKGTEVLIGTKEQTTLPSSKGMVFVLWLDLSLLNYQFIKCQ